MDDLQGYSILWEKLLFASARGIQIVCAVDAIRNDISSRGMQKINDYGNKFIFLLYNMPTKFLHYAIRNKFYKTLSRHHEKIIVVDDKAFIGSGNMKEEYGGSILGTNMFRDVYAVIKKGPLKRIFGFMRETVSSKERKYIPNPDNSEFFNDKMEYYKDENEKFEIYFEAPKQYEEIRKKLIKLMNSAKERIVIVQPYFQRVPSITKAILDARKRGVKVIIITARDRDLMIYHYMPNNILFREFIKKGCEVYEDRNKFLHAKLYFIDNKKFSLGIICYYRRIV